jgi:hypothetical protein
MISPQGTFGAPTISLPPIPVKKAYSLRPGHARRPTGETADPTTPLPPAVPISPLMTQEYSTGADIYRRCLIPTPRPLGLDQATLRTCAE